MKFICRACKWYAEFEGVCTNGYSPHRADFINEENTKCKYYEDLELNKIAVYLDLIKKFQKEGLYDLLLSRKIERGNLAYFVDQYYNKPHAADIFKNVEMFLVMNNVNSLCYCLADKIYNKTKTDKKLPAEIKKDADKAIKYFQELYSVNNLKNFFIMDRYYPEWFEKAEKLILKGY